MPRYTGEQVLVLMRALLDNKLKFRPDAYWKRYRQLRRLFYKSTEWQRLRAAVHREMPHCFSDKSHPGSRHAHHIKYLATHPELGLVRENIIPLCTRCHKRVHKEH